jgi:hypothetical protein
MRLRSYDSAELEELCNIIFLWYDVCAMSRCGKEADGGCSAQLLTIHPQLRKSQQRQVPPRCACMHKIAPSRRNVVAQIFFRPTFTLCRVVAKKPVVVVALSQLLHTPNCENINNHSCRRHALTYIR